MSRVIFFEKSKCDFSLPNVSASASEGNDYAERPLNRSNLSSWITTGSLDANNTWWEVDFGEVQSISEILLIQHNFKNYTIQYWDGSAYQDFSTPINVSNNTSADKWHRFNAVNAFKVKIVITGTMTADDDKTLAQFIATNMIGQLTAQPLIKDPTFDKRKVRATMLSGKEYVVDNVGGFKVDLAVEGWTSGPDRAVIEELFDLDEGFLPWLCGGDETQFVTLPYGYRMRDLPLMKCVNAYQPEFRRGNFKAGLSLILKLAEVTA